MTAILALNGLQALQEAAMCLALVAVLAENAIPNQFVLTLAVLASQGVFLHL